MEEIIPGEISPPMNIPGSCDTCGMAVDTNRSELGTFLKNRRGQLSPSQVGLPEGSGTRRVAGLRREEVATLVGISTDYYTRIEQGRIGVSASVLSGVARALALDEDQRRYLFNLAGKPSAKSPRPARQKVRPQLQRLLDELTTMPAVVLGARTDVLAWNRLAAAMLLDFSRVPLRQRNYVRILFTDPAMRSLYVDWEQVARTAVAQLRMEAGRNPDDPRLTSLVGELSVQDPQFATWWASQSVASMSTGTKTLDHPRVGRLVLDWDTLSEADDCDQRLVIWTAEPGSATHDALRRLAEETAD